MYVHEHIVLLYIHVCNYVLMHSPCMHVHVCHVFMYVLDSLSDALITIYTKAHVYVHVTCEHFMQ